MNFDTCQNLMIAMLIINFIYSIIAMGIIIYLGIKIKQLDRDIEYVKKLNR